MILPEEKRDDRPRIHKYEIVERIGLVKENRKGNRIELNYIKWDGRPAVYDLRLWIKEEDGTYTPTRGLKLYYEDLMILGKILADL